MKNVWNVNTSTNIISPDLKLKYQSKIKEKEEIEVKLPTLNNNDLVNKLLKLNNEYRICILINSDKLKRFYSSLNILRQNSNQVLIDYPIQSTILLNSIFVVGICCLLLFAVSIIIDVIVIAICSCCFYLSMIFDVFCY